MAALMTTGLLVLLSAISLSAGELSSGPIKWFDADNKHIPEPAEIVENQVWDIADHTLFFQIGKLLDLGWTARAHRQHPERGRTQRSATTRMPWMRCRTRRGTRTAISCIQ